MKMKIQKIALLVGAVLVAVFLYQSWWLLRLYRNEARQMRHQIQLAVVQADYLEMDYRTHLLSSSNGIHGNISFSAGAQLDDKDSSYVEQMTRKDIGDSTFIELERHKITADERQAMKQHPVRQYFRDRHNDSLLMKENPMLGMSYTVQRTMHKSLRDLAKPNYERYDSILTALLKDAGGSGPHLVEVTDEAGRPTDTLGTCDYRPTPRAEHFSYYLTEDTHEAYRLTIEPVTSLVLQQMAGILAASAVILLVLAFAFCYLIWTLKRMRSLDEMKTDFTNNITHELKTPISVAYAANDALLNFSSLSPKAQEYLRISQEQLTKLSGMVEKILSMSMEHRKTLALNVTHVRLEELVGSLIEIHRLKSQQAVDFHIDLQPDNLEIKADRNHLTAMLSNLIDNAIKYARDDHADITIRGRDNLVEITDKGIGIPHDKLRYVCDRFYRVPQGNRHDVKGYGLGLYYVKSMMERHGGSVEIESKEGEGTTVRLRFNG